MPNVRLFTLNGSGGAFTLIPASIPTRYMHIIEDESVAPQGLIYQSVTDNFANTCNVGPGTEPIVLGNPETQGGGVGPILGLPEQNKANGTAAFNYRAADTLLKVKSAQAAGGNVLRVTEYE